MAVRFDAAADRLSHQGTYPVPATAITITMWVRVEVDRNDFQTFARLHDGATLITFSAQGDGTSGPGHFTGGGGADFADDLGAVGVWVPIATTRAGTAAKVYRRVAGGATTTVASGTITGVTGTPSGICLGGRGGEAGASNDAAEWLNGSVAHVRIWSAELTQAEIEAEWASPTPVRSSGFFDAWPLATATDLTSVNGRTLVVQTGGAVATATGPVLLDSRPTTGVGCAAGMGSATPRKRALSRGVGQLAAAGSATPRKRALSRGLGALAGIGRATAAKRAATSAAGVAAAIGSTTTARRATVAATAFAAATGTATARKRAATVAAIVGLAIALQSRPTITKPPGPLRLGAAVDGIGRARRRAAVDGVGRARLR